MRYSFDAADAPTPRRPSTTRCSAPAASGTRAGRRSPSTRRCRSGKGHFDQDRWQLFHTDVDRAEAHDLAEQHPDKVKELVDLWFAEAKKYDVLPLNDLGVLDYIKYEFQAAVPKSGVYTYFPGTAEVPERSAANVHGVSYKILADVEIADPSAQGVILAQGSRFGGHALFVKDRKLHYVYNFLGIKPEQHLESEPLEPGGHVLGVEFVKERPASTASPTARPSSTSTTTSSPKARCAPSPGTSRCAAKGFASAATPATPSASTTRRSSRSKADGSSRSRSAPATTPTSTSSSSSEPRWRATEHGFGGDQGFSAGR